MEEIDLTSSSPPFEDAEDSPFAGHAGSTTTTTIQKQIDPAIALANRNIDELNKIDEKISTLLLHAGLAIKALTTPVSAISDPNNPNLPPHCQSTSSNSQLQPPHPTQPASLPNQLENFKSHAQTFHNLLDSIRVNLRRQILLQDQAEIIAPMPTGTTASGSSGAAVAGGAGGAGVAGIFDVGLLNGRSDAVGKDMEAELWEKARAFVDNLERVREAAEAERQLLGGRGPDGEVEDVDMK